MLESMPFRKRRADDLKSDPPEIEGQQELKPPRCNSQGPTAHLQNGGGSRHKCRLQCGAYTFRANCAAWAVIAAHDRCAVVLIYVPSLTLH